MNIFKTILKEGLVLFILFNLGRILFLLGYGTFDSIGDIPQLFAHSLRLDLTTVALCVATPFLSIILRPILNGQLTFNIIKYSSILLAILISMIYAGEIITYYEWGTKLNYKVFVHLSNPSEVYQTGGFGQMGVFALICIVMMGSYFYLRKTHFLGFTQLKDSITTPIATNKQRIFSVLQFIILAPMLAIIIRGGIQPIPINLSSAYFTNNMILNDAAVNSLWSLGSSITENQGNFDNKNPFKFMEDEEAQVIVDDLSLLLIESRPEYSDTIIIAPIQLFTIDKPNIVLIIMESWSANVISSMRGPKDITPNFDRLTQEGLLFTEFYASGYTSDLAMPAIFSSFHALPIASIVTQPSKAKRLPSLARHLNINGYSTSFYFGGQLQYGNIKSYLMLQDFQKIVEEDDLSKDLPRGRLGIHDEYMFNIHQEELANSTDRPFFSTLFTLSSHAPYDMPIKSTRQYDTKHNEYLNSVHYTDSCLGAYFEQLKSHPFYDETIFIITGDHGHYAPESGSKFSKTFNNIPLLIFGKPLDEQYKGQQRNQVSSQVDLAPTLLEQLNIPSNKFTWGKNLLRQGCPEYAYYSGPNSISWVRPYGSFAYENRFERFMHLELSDSTRQEELVDEGKAYGQLVFKDYLER